MARTRMLPKAAFDKIGCGYDKGMQMVRKGEFDGTYYRIGNKVIFIEEALDEWIDRRLHPDISEYKGLRKIQ